jgi:hypothetical protein
VGRAIAVQVPVRPERAIVRAEQEAVERSRVRFDVVPDNRPSDRDAVDRVSECSTYQLVPEGAVATGTDPDVEMLPARRVEC